MVVLNFFFYPDFRCIIFIFFPRMYRSWKKIQLSLDSCFSLLSIISNSCLLKFLESISIMFFVNDCILMMRDCLFESAFYHHKEAVHILGQKGFFCISLNYEWMFSIIWTMEINLHFKCQGYMPRLCAALLLCRNL